MYMKSHNFKKKVFFKERMNCILPRTRCILIFPINLKISDSIQPRDTFDFYVCVVVGSTGYTPKSTYSECIFLLPRCVCVFHLAMCIRYQKFQYNSYTRIAQNSTDLICVHQADTFSLFNILFNTHRNRILVQHAIRYFVWCVCVNVSIVVWYGLRIRTTTLF